MMTVGALRINGEPGVNLLLNRYQAESLLRLIGDSSDCLAIELRAKIPYVLRVLDAEDRQIAMDAARAAGLLNSHPLGKSSDSTPTSTVRETILHRIAKLFTRARAKPGQ